MSQLAKTENQLITQFLQSYPEKAVYLLESFSEKELREAVCDLSVSNLKKLLNSLKPERAASLFTSLPDEEFRTLFSDLDPVRAAYLFSKADPNSTESKKHLLTDAETKDLDDLSAYPPDSAGSLMDTSLRTCRPGETVKEVLSGLRKTESLLREVFVTDLEGKLVGYLPVQELIFSPDETHIESLMHKSPPYVNALSPKTEVTEVFESFKTTSLPVLHVDGTLLGAIRYTSLVKAVQNQALSTMASLGGASPSENALSPPIFSVKKRLPWLAINLLTAFIASAVVGFFEGTIAKVTALAVLLPVVAGQSGNTGAQAMAVAMRGLALREVRPRQWAKLLFKELRVGLLNGVAIAIVTGSAVYFWSQNLPLGIVMTVAMTGSMIIASISGAAIPMILTSMGKDPAQSSSVILTTVTDVMGFLSFLGLATLFLSLLEGAAAAM